MESNEQSEPIRKIQTHREQAESSRVVGGAERVEGLSKKEKKEKELMDTDNCGDWGGWGMGGRGKMYRGINDDGKKI